MSTHSNHSKRYGSRKYNSKRRPSKTRTDFITKYISERNLIIVAAIVIAIIVLVVILISSNTLNKKEADALVREKWNQMINGQEQDTTATYGFDEYLSATDATNTLSDSDIAVESDPIYLTTFDTRSSFTLVDMKRKGNCYTLTYAVSAPDVRNGIILLLNDQGNSGFTESSLDLALAEIVSNSDLATTNAEVFISKENGKYIVRYSDAFIDAMYGGIYSLAFELLEMQYVSNSDVYE